MTQAEGFFARLRRELGGRKVMNGYIATALLTAMAFPLKATFNEYMLGVLLALGITNTLVAWEDSRKTGGVT